MVARDGSVDHVKDEPPSKIRRYAIPEEGHVLGEAYCVDAVPIARDVVPDKPEISHVRTQEDGGIRVPNKRILGKGRRVRDVEFQPPPVLGHVVSREEGTSEVSKKQTVVIAGNPILRDCEVD